MLTTLYFQGSERASTEDADKKVVAGVEVRIAGAGYRQTVKDEGKFSFENWQTYGLLESGKTYCSVN